MSLPLLTFLTSNLQLTISNNFLNVMNAIDISGMRFDRLTAIKSTDIRVAKKVMWECLCDCGNKTLANVSQLKQGRRTSCGCAQIAGNQIYKKTPKHGHFVGDKPSTTYRIWTGMRTRCSNPKTTSWPHYGGRGIKVCERWKNFENFLADMGERPEGKSLDRINNDGDYCPENCRWATDIEQHRNRSDNVYWSHAGSTKTIAEWADVTGLNKHTLSDRVRKSGWTIEQALITPVQTRSQVVAKVNLKRWGHR